MKTVVVAKIVYEALCTSWNFSSAHCLHHIMKVENRPIILKYEGDPRSNANTSVISSHLVFLKVVYMYIMIYYRFFEI